jgi:hypothetical protein
MFATWVRAFRLNSFARTASRPLIAGKVESPLTDLFTKDAIFFGEVVDTDLLMLIELGSEAGKKEQNGLRNAGMGRCYHLAWSRLCQRFQRV